MIRVLLLSLGVALGGTMFVSAQGDEQALPASVDLRPKFASFGLTPKAQGQRDTCSLFAITGLVEFEVANANAGNGSTPLSEEYLIWAANEAAGGATDQAMFYEAVQGLETFGICANKLMPYRGGRLAARPPSQAASRDASSRRMWEPQWIKRWDVKSGLSTEQLEALKQQLAQEHPVAVGLRWPKANRSRPGQIIEVPRPEQVFDGHSVLFVGYRDDPSMPGGGTFTFRNSAGANWGEKGYGSMSYAYAAAYANDALALTMAPADSAAKRRNAAWIEAESLPRGGRCSANVQDMAPYGSKMWSGGHHVFAACEAGHSTELAFPVSNAGRHTVSVLMTCAPDFGRCSFAIDDVPIGGEFDGYSGRVHPSGRIVLGDVELAPGVHKLAITVTDKHPVSEGYKLGIDAIGLSTAE